MRVRGYLAVGMFIIGLVALSTEVIAVEPELDSDRKLPADTAVVHAGLLSALDFLTLPSDTCLGGNQVSALTRDDYNVVGLSCPCGPTVSTQPLQPMVGDSITITVSCQWPNGCLPTYQSNQLVGNTIEVSYLYPTGFCPPVITDWTHPVDVGVFAKGVYTVDVYLTGVPGAATDLCATREFLVAETIYYFPIVFK